MATSPPQLAVWAACSVPVGTDATYGYDALERFVSITRNGDVQTLTYNSAGQVTGVLNVGAGDVDYNYEYDALGRRTKTTDTNGGEQRYLWAPAAQRLGGGVLDVEVQHLAADSTGNLLAGWVLAGENPILRFHGAAGSEQIQYYLEDGSDSVAALVDEMAALVAEYRYDGFGNNLDDVLYDDPGTGAAAIASLDGEFGLDGDFGFHAAWRETETGLYHMRAQTYDPETGRFTSPDPAEPNPQVPESYHPYSFANNNPVLFSDPTGLFSLTEINVSNSISTTLHGLKNVAIQQARNFTKDKIEEFAAEALVSLIGRLIPKFGNVDLDALDDIEAIGLSSRLGTMFQDFVQDVICTTIGGSLGGIDRYFWIEPVVQRNGRVINSGINCQNLANLPQYLSQLSTTERFTPRPDYIINPGDPQDGGSWLIGDMTLSANGLLRKYVSPGNQQGQWMAITNHAENFGSRVSLFLTFRRGTKATFDALSAKLAAEGFKEGTIVYVLSLISK